MEKFKHKKTLGQNFLKNDTIIKKIVEEVSPNPEDLIIEIGPGQGALTKELQKYNSNLVCFEVDQRLKSYLENIINEKTQIIFEDFLKVNLDEYKKYKSIYIVANLPYYITTPIINKIIKDQLNPKKIVIMVQKEVGERFSSLPGNKEYSAISVYLQYFYDIKKIIDVNKKEFIPVPKVDSVVISMERKKESIKPNNEEIFFKLIQDSFKLKRKTLKNNLSNYNWKKIKSILEKLNLPENIRAEQLSLEQFIEISNNLN